MRITILLFVSLLLLTGSALGEYKIDSSHAQVSFEVTHLGIMPMKGSFADFDIEIDFDKKGISSLKGTADVDSLNTGNKKRDTHLKTDEFFDAKNHSKLIFEMTSYESGEDEGKVAGKLTMRGVTKEVVFMTKISKEIKSPRGNKMVRSVHLSGDVNRLDFNIGKDFSGKMISEKIKIEIAFEVIKPN